MSAFNYSIIRFMPYIDREEFVNIGIVAYRSTGRKLEFKICESMQDRWKDFFGGYVDDEVYKNFVDSVSKNLEQKKSFMQKFEGGSFDHHLKEVFAEIISPKEGILKFSGVRTCLGKLPLDLEVLIKYNYYVRVDQ